MALWENILKGTNEDYRKRVGEPVIWNDGRAVAYCVGDEEVGFSQLTVYTDPGTPDEATNVFAAFTLGKANPMSRQEMFSLAEEFFNNGALGAK